MVIAWVICGTGFTKNLFHKQVIHKQMIQTMKYILKMGKEICSVSYGFL